MGHDLTSPVSMVYYTRGTKMKMCLSIIVLCVWLPLAFMIVPVGFVVNAICGGYRCGNSISGMAATYLLKVVQKKQSCR